MFGLVIAYGVNDLGSRWAGVHVMVVESVTGFLESACCSIGLVDHKVVVISTVESDLILVLDP